MSQQQLWVGEDGQRHWPSAAEPLAVLEILCWSCWNAGRGDRRLALVAVSTRLGAGPMLWTLAFTTSAGPATNQWRGEGESKRLVLVCGIKTGRGGRSDGGCRHEPDVRRTWIASQLAEIAEPDKRTIRHVYR